MWTTKGGGRRVSARPKTDRRGGFTVVAGACLVAAIAFAALSVDIGLIAYTKTRLRNAVDAAALAAAQEISASVEAVGEQGGSAGDATAIAEAAARAMAERVASLNGVYIDPGRDVQFGKRVYNAGAKRFDVNWGSAPYNAVKVTAHMDNDEADAPDAALNLLFASFFGNDSQKLVASAAAFVEARDLVLVLDYTASMNDDSTYNGIAKLGRPAVEANMLQIYNALGLNLPSFPATPDFVTLTGAASGGPTVSVTFKGNQVAASSPQNITQVKLTFDNGGTQTFNFNAKSVTATGTGGNAKRYVTKAEVTSNSKKATINFTAATIKTKLGLTGTYPFSGGSWDDYIDQTLTAGIYKYNYGYDTMGGYDWKFGRLNYVQYLLNNRHKYTDTNKLWKTPHYPFHAMKEGATLFCDYMDDLDFGDEVGLVTYDESARVETYLNEPLDGTVVDISSNPITGNYSAIDKIQRHKQAGHYASMTGIGYGVDKAIELLKQHGRYGARPTILLMTDGNANVAPSGWKKPNGWDWSKLTDYDGNGTADYTTTDVNKLYAFYQAKRAIDLDYTIHTMSVGLDSDDSLMKAIAFAGKGQFVDVPGGSTIAAQEAQLKDAFRKIATNVPPAKLLIERED